MTEPSLFGKTVWQVRMLFNGQEYGKLRYYQSDEKGNPPKVMQQTISREKSRGVRLYPGYKIEHRVQRFEFDSEVIY